MISFRWEITRFHQHLWDTPYTNFRNSVMHWDTCASRLRFCCSDKSLAIVVMSSYKRSNDYKSTLYGHFTEGDSSRDVVYSFILKLSSAGVSRPQLCDWYFARKFDGFQKFVSVPLICCEPSFSSFRSWLGFFIIRNWKDIKTYMSKNGTPISICRNYLKPLNDESQQIAA